MHARRYAALSVLVCTVAAATVALSGQAPAASDVGAKTWLGRHQEWEDFIKKAPTVGKMERVPVGVTRPMKVALEPGGPVEFIAWKPIRPGFYGDVYESYKSEIAAYEVDKLLGLDMVPPTVEKRIGRDTGAAIAWIAGMKTFAELGPAIVAPAPHAERWNLQLARAMMYHNLIGDEDPNLGNWMVDAGWNLVLIDHSRSLRDRADLYHQMNQIDRALWERMKRLDEPTLTAALGAWLGKREIRAILERRARMQQAIDRLVKEKGERQVFIDTRKSG